MHLGRKTPLDGTNDVSHPMKTIGLIRNIGKFPTQTMKNGRNLTVHLVV